MPDQLPVLPLYSHIDTGPWRELSLDDYVPNIWESARAAFGQAWRSNPLPAMQAWADTHPGQRQGTVLSGLDDYAAAGVAGAAREAVQPWQGGMAEGEQRRRIAESGLAGMLKPDPAYDEKALETVIAARKADLAAGEAAARQPWTHAPFSLMAAFTAGMLDPLNIASAFIPGIGEERAMRMLAASAHSLAGRSAARAAQGAAGGAIGAAVMEPLVYTGQKAIQADYSLADSLLNVSFGAVAGAALQPAAGLVGEWLARRRGAILPWEMGLATPQSLAMLKANARRFEETRMAARPDQDQAAVASASLADAMTWDGHMRRLAFEEGITAHEAYSRHGFELRDGEAPRREALRQEARAARLELELEEMAERQGLADGLPELRIRQEDMTAAALRLEQARARAAGAWRQASQELDAMFGGDSAFSPAADGGSQATGGLPEQAGPGSAGGEADGGLAAGIAPEPGTPTGGMAASQGGSAAPGIGGAITFSRDFLVDGRAVVSIFESHDSATIRHGLAHLMLRQYEALASSPAASPGLRRQARALRRHFGIGEDGQWSAAQRDNFAAAFTNWLAGGQPPSAGLAQAFAVMKAQAGDMYAAADAAGVNISRSMRELLGGMISTPMDEGDRLLRVHLADISTRRWEREFLPRSGPSRPGEAVGLDYEPSPAAASDPSGSIRAHDAPADPAASLQALGRIVQDLHDATERELAREGIAPPEARERIRQERDAAMAQLDAEMNRADARLMADYVACLRA